MSLFPFTGTLIGISSHDAILLLKLLRVPRVYKCARRSGLRRLRGRDSWVGVLAIAH